MTKIRNFYSLFKQALKGESNHNYTDGPIGKAAFLLAVPMVLEMAMESIFAVTDMFFVASLGSEAIAVVGLTEAVVTLLYAVAIGLSMGVTAMISRRVGEKKLDQANFVAAQALWAGLLVALLVGVIGLFFAEKILVLMGGSESVVREGKHYTTTMLGGSVTILYLFLINAIFRGAGDASIAMRSLWLANGINIVLDPMLIYGVGPFPEMGVTGAAVATTIGRGVGVIYQLSHLLNNKHRITLRIEHLKPNFAILNRLIRVSTGGILQFLIATASWVALVRIIATFGSDAVAGYTIAIRIIVFTILPSWGLGNAAATLVGQNLGAGEPERAEQSVWTIARFNLVFMICVAIIFIVFAPFLVGVFTSDPTVSRYAISCLRYISYGYGFYAVGMVLVQAFNGAGDTMTPTKINFFCYWLCQIPLAYLLAHRVNLGPDGVFLAIALIESLIAIVGLIIFRRGHWKLKSV